MNTAKPYICLCLLCHRRYQGKTCGDFVQAHHLTRRTCQDHRQKNSSPFYRFTSVAYLAYSDIVHDLSYPNCKHNGCSHPAAHGSVPAHGRISCTQLSRCARLLTWHFVLYRILYTHLYYVFYSSGDLLCESVYYVYIYLFADGVLCFMQPAEFHLGQQQCKHMCACAYAYALYSYYNMCVKYYTPMMLPDSGVIIYMGINESSVEV
jgi:hypothetical protein